MSAKAPGEPLTNQEIIANLADALERLNALEARIKIVEDKRMERAEATKVARIALAAKRSGFDDVDAWLRHCKSVGWKDPARMVPKGWQVPKRKRNATRG